MNISQISAGRDRSVALTDDGQAFGWGSVRLLGATLPPGYPGELCSSNPTEIGHNRYAQPVPQRLNHQPYAAICEGYNEFLGICSSGELVSGLPLIARETGAKQSVVPGVRPAAISVAMTESAAFARYANGEVWSWGHVFQGQLGRAADPGLPAEAQRPAGLPGLPACAALVAGHGHVLALTPEGQVWAWGANAAGQLGLGSLTSGGAPAPLAIEARIQQVAAGDTHSLAVDDRGRLWAWGSNNWGQLGTPAVKFSSTPLRVPVGFKVARVDAGMFFSVATSTAGDAFAWGWNGLGQLGHRAALQSAQAVRIRGLTQVSQIAAGENHVLALGRVGRQSGLWAWGDNRASACGALPSTRCQLEPRHIPLA